MLKLKYFQISALILMVGLASCTKLNETYTTTVPINQADSSLGPAFPGLLLTAAYNDFPSVFVGQDELFSLEENSTDESLVPTRGGDWDDNGVWRVIHNHTWNADHTQILQVFNNLNKINFDATNVLQFAPSVEQAAEARFLRAFTLYYILDLYGQFPFRNPGDNLLNAPKVYRGDSAVSFLINELTTIMPNLSTKNTASQANQTAAQVLLMRLYLNRGAFDNRANPTFADADMQQVITLGNAIINGGAYKYMNNYFQNFNYSNGTSSELIFGYPGNSGVSSNNPGMDARWMMTFHYNEFDAQAPNAGWNGFSTISDFYNSYSVGGTTNYSLADTLLDTRIGRRYNSDIPSTVNSGIRPGYLVGQQYDQKGNALQDRHGNPLSFTPVIASNMIETGSNLEVTGIRVDKYPPDFSNPTGSYYSSNPGNWLVLMRYPEVVLMVAEALMREASPDNATAMTLVNGLRTARGAAPMTTLNLNPVSNGGNSLVDDPNSLLAERGRELYWESFRRTDLIRFNVFLTPWQYKPSDNAMYLLFPVPNQALAVNPNLIQNPGY